jgi:hypothetical protein
MLYEIKKEDLAMIINELKKLEYEEVLNFPPMKDAKIQQM